MRNLYLGLKTLFFLLLWRRETKVEVRTSKFKFECAIYFMTPAFGTLFMYL